jgi:hypothetical protein
MATFTWQATSGTAGWETNGAGGWGGTPNYAGTDTFNVNGTGTLTIDAIGGVNGSDSAGVVTVNDPHATLSVNTLNNPDFNISTSLLLNAGTLTLGTQGALFMGDVGSGTVTLGTSAVITDIGGAGTDTFISNNGPSTTISGAGTIIAAQGILDIQSGVTVTGGDTTAFQIASNGVLEFDDAVGGGTVTFLSDSGLLLLTAPQVGDGTILSNGTFAASISGLTVGASLTNGIDIQASTSITSAVLSGTENDVLTVSDQSGDQYTFKLTGDYSGASARVAVDAANGGFDVFLVCYAAGTKILTDQGESPVETIQPGDRVMTVAGGVLKPGSVKWVGHRHLDLTRHPNREAVAPVRILKGALRDNVPHRDLVVSPDHCLFINGGLYPAKLLVNGMTIVRDLEARSVSYYHIELERHSVLIAEGVPAESYLDTGNRAFFSNAGLAVILHPELTINENLRCWEKDACAPLMVKPEIVRPVWQRYADRATALGFAPPSHATTQDAGIHLLVDGRPTRPLTSDGDTVCFMLPAGARSVHLRSRAARPDILTPWVDDQRKLGIAVRSITLRDRTGETVIGADHPALQKGWHAAERAADGAVWRWSAGDAELPIQSSGPCALEIALGATLLYADRIAA